MMKFIVVLAIFTGLAASVPRFPNARYLGMGYNLIKGDPSNNDHDTGFTFEVMQLTWNNHEMTSGHRFEIPDDIQALQSKSCSFESEVTKVHGSRSYQNSLSVAVSVEGGYTGLIASARFSASTSYSRMSQSTSEERHIYTSAVGKCIEHELALNYHGAPAFVNEDFARGVNALPLTRNNATYHAFIDTYGTHFTTRVLMGAKMIVKTEFTEIAWSKLEQEGVHVEAAAQVSYASVASGGFSTETSTEEENREKFEEQRYNKYEAYVGSHPPRDGNWQTWAEASGDAPYPVAYTLAPLTSLLDEKFFPDMPASELTTRRSLLTEAYESYCYVVQGCEIPGPDPEPLRMEDVHSTYYNQILLRCPNHAANMLSCGMHDVARPGTGAIPYSSNTCKCIGEATCRAWCTNADISSSIRNAYSANVWATASCPRGYKVCTGNDVLK